MTRTRVSGEFPAPTYADVVLAPAWTHAGHALLDPMLAAHRAWAVMLAEQGLVAPGVAAALLRGIDEIDAPALSAQPYDGAEEDLFFAVEAELTRRIGEEAAGSLHLARSRNDLGQALYRMALRSRLLRTIAAATRLHGVFVDFGERFAEATMLAHTHTQPAQPTTLGHWFLAAADVLERDLGRLQAAYRTVNRSPLGAAALSGTGFTIDRERVRELLGFDTLVENSYDAIGGADYFTESAAALQLSAVHTGRVANDLLTWCMAEHQVLRLSDGYVQVSSIMPQKRNPVALEHVRGMLSRVAGDAATVITMVHNTPFGDINDTEDDLQPAVWRAAEGFAETAHLLAAALASADVDIEHLRARAGTGFATITQLADHMVTTLGLPFRAAHHIASTATRAALAAGRHSIDARTLDEAAREVIGRPADLPEDEVERVQDPVHFVAVRTSRGGVAPSEVHRMAADRAGRQGDLERWRLSAAEDLTVAEERLAAADLQRRGK